MWQNRKWQVKKKKKKHALSQRVLYKISHLTISSLVVISDKRRGQVNLYHQLETIHLNSENFSLVRQWLSITINSAFASANSKLKVRPCGTCRSFLRLRLVFIIKCDKVGFSISFPSVVYARKSRLRANLGQQFYFTSYFYPIHSHNWV